MTRKLLNSLRNLKNFHFQQKNKKKKRYAVRFKINSKSFISKQLVAIRRDLAATRYV